MPILQVCSTHVGPIEMLVPLTSSSIPSRALAASWKLIMPVARYHFRLSRGALWEYSLQRMGSRKGSRKRSREKKWRRTRRKEEEKRRRGEEEKRRREEEKRRRGERRESERGMEKMSRIKSRNKKKSHTFVVAAHARLLYVYILVHCQCDWLQ